jgi:hypothetical protein
VDVLHLGDVIEHLTRVDDQLPAILALLKPGAYLIAQGPLEANANLFQSLLRVFSAAKGGRSIEMAPYHVLLATAKGQRELFRRFGLREVEFEVSEVFWPAPARVTVRDLLLPRRVALHFVRRLSRVVSRIRPREWGNRYFYIGRVGLSSQTEE